MLRRLAPAAVVWLLLSTVVWPQPAQPVRASRQIFVRATDEIGAPVLSLTGADFRIVENGVVRPVVQAGAAAGPMRIVLLVDNSNATSQFITHLRTGLLAFLDAVPAHHEIALATSGGQFRVRVPPTTDQKMLRDAASGLFADGGGSNTLVDSLTDARNRFHRQPGVRWPVFVIVTGDGPDMSGALEQAFNRLRRDLRGTGTTSHAVIVSTRNAGVPHLTTWLLTQASGGYFQAIAASTGLTGRLLEVVDRIADDEERMRSWYQVEYTSTRDDTSDVKIQAEVLRLGVSVELAAERPPK